MTAPIGKVFVSHSSMDKPFVDRLVADLAAMEIPVWYDKFDMKVGDSVTESIDKGLASAKYFLIVLSRTSIGSRWVGEELNVALMRQVAQGGTFLLPVLLEDCDVPPLLQHRRYADFRSNYDRGLSDLLGVWGKDREAALIANGKPLYPWPDLAAAEQDFVYLYSIRFDKFFRMTCNLSSTANRTTDYIVDTLKLPWGQDVHQLGMKWSFGYRLIFDDKGIDLSATLRDAGVGLGSFLKMAINGKYEDVWEREQKEMWDETKVYEMLGAMRREAELKETLRSRGSLNPERLRELADTCFAHV